MFRIFLDEKDEEIRKINNHVEEVQELVGTFYKYEIKVFYFILYSNFILQLEQIGLEIREADSSVKNSLTNRLQCYQAELKRLKQEFVKASKPDSATISLYESSDEMRSHPTLLDEQQRRLLDNSERIERSGNRLADGYRTILETEQLGTAVLQDLSHQRETLQRSRSRVSFCFFFLVVF